MIELTLAIAAGIFISNLLTDILAMRANKNDDDDDDYRY